MQTLQRGPIEILSVHPNICVRSRLRQAGADQNVRSYTTVKSAHTHSCHVLLAENVIDISHTGSGLLPFSQSLLEGFYWDSRQM